MSSKAAWWVSLERLVFPQLCLACSRPIDALDEQYVCGECSLELPWTNHHELSENELTDRLAGRIRLEFGGALFFYQADTTVQRMVHAFKYYGQQRLAYELGCLHGSRLCAHPRLADVSAVVPVPLHPRRMAERGFNQAAIYGRGLAEKLNAPLWSQLLRRQTFAGSQTKRSKSDRLQNVAKTFVADKGSIDQVHILLVDDVLTTGATLDLCAEALVAAYPDTRISVATVGLSI